MIFELLVAGAFALATLRRSSLAKTIILASFLLFLSSIVPNSTSGISVRDFQPVADSMPEEFPWINPCGHTENQMNVYQRKARSMKYNIGKDILERVNTQFRITWNHFKKHINVMRRIYHKREPFDRNSDFTLLKRDQLKLNGTELECASMMKKTRKILPRLRKELQIFSVTFYRLRNFNLVTNSTTCFFKKRLTVLHNIQNYLIRIMCEVDDGIASMRLPTPILNHKASITDKVRLSNEGDLTIMFILDWGVFKAYNNFLEDWIKVLNLFVPAMPIDKCSRNATISRSNADTIEKLPGKMGKRKSKTKKRMKKYHVAHGRNNSSSQNRRRSPRTRHQRRKKKLT